MLLADDLVDPAVVAQTDQHDMGADGAEEQRNSEAERHQLGVPDLLQHHLDFAGGARQPTVATGGQEQLPRGLRDPRVDVVGARGEREREAERPRGPAECHGLKQSPPRARLAEAGWPAAGQ